MKYIEDENVPYNSPHMMLITEWPIHIGLRFRNPTGAEFKYDEISAAIAELVAKLEVGGHNLILEEISYRAPFALNKVKIEFTIDGSEES